MKFLKSFKALFAMKSLYSCFRNLLIAFTQSLVFSGSTKIEFFEFNTSFKTDKSDAIIAFY